MSLSENLQWLTIVHTVELRLSELAVCHDLDFALLFSILESHWSLGAHIHLPPPQCGSAQVVSSTPLSPA